VALSDIPDNAATAGREFGLRDSMADDKSTQRRRVACVASMVTFMATNLANEPGFGSDVFIHYEFTAKGRTNT
jgi:hypothetical protein